MVASSITQVETFDFEPLRDRPHHAGSLDLHDLLFGESGTFSSSVPGHYPAPVRLAGFTIALRKRASRPASLFTTA